MRSALDLFEGKRKLFWVLAALAVLADQASKVLLWELPKKGTGHVVRDLYLVQIVRHPGNPGGAFGLPGGPVLYAAAALVGLSLIAAFFATTAPGRSLMHAGLGLMAGGAVGNLVDRLLLGVVRDFIEFPFPWPAFNVADALICTGFGLVLVNVLFGPNVAQAEAEPRAG